MNMGRKNKTPLARPEDVARFCQETAESFCDTEKAPELLDLRIVLGRTAFVTEVCSRSSGLRRLIPTQENELGRREYAFGRTVGEKGVFELSLLARACNSEDLYIAPLQVEGMTEKTLAELLWLRQVTPELR
jgi:hypothetical protein